MIGTYKMKAVITKIAKIVGATLIVYILLAVGVSFLDYSIQQKNYNEFLSNKCDCGEQKCKTRGLPVKSDRLTFEQVCRTGITIDDQHVYRDGSVIVGLEPASFVMLSAWYYKDHDSVYNFYRKTISEADTSTFEVINDTDPWTAFAKDKNYVYQNGNILDGLDPGTFELLTRNIWKDKNGVYRDSPLNRIEEADPETFELLDHFFAKDSDTVFRTGGIVEVLEGADAPSFTVINEQYAKDKYVVYFYGRSLPLVHTDSFQLLSVKGCSAHYGIDNAHVYYEDKIIPGADPVSFQGTGECYAQDDKGYYFHQFQVQQNHKEMCNFDDPEFSDENILSLYPLHNTHVDDFRPTITGKIVTYDLLPLDIEFVQAYSPYGSSGETQHVNLIPGKLKNVTFYLDNNKITDVYGLAQFSYIRCDEKTPEMCFTKYKTEFPPLLFFYKPASNLSAGKHTFTVDFGTYKKDIVFTIDSEIAAQTKDTVCSPLGSEDLYFHTNKNSFHGVYHVCPGGYYRAGSPEYVPIPSYRNDNLYHTLSFPRSAESAGRYSTSTIVYIKIDGRLFDLKLPSSEHFYSSKESKNSASPTDSRYIPYENGLYLPHDILYFANGTPAVMYSDYSQHILDLVPIDSSGHIHGDKIITHQGGNSSGCDG